MFSAITLVATSLVEITIGIVLWRRKLLGRFRWFFIYMVYSLVRDGARLATSGNQTWYLYTYWGTEPISAALRFAAVWESFSHVLHSFKRLRWFPWVLWGSVVVALGYSTWKALVHPTIQSSREISLIIAAELTTEFIISVICLLYLGVLRFFHIPFRQRESMIILGFAVGSITFIIGAMLRSLLGERFMLVSQYLPPVGYLVAEVYWLLGIIPRESSFYSPEVLAARLNLSSDDMLRQVTQYIELMKKAGKR